MKKCIGTYSDQELDAEVGLYNFNARLYDPAIGIFISPDSIVQDIYDPQTLNPYSYARNNPLIYVDPTGNAWDLFDIGSFLYSVVEFIKDPSVTNGALLLWDTVALLPVMPSSGTARASFEAARQFNKFWIPVFEAGAKGGFDQGILTYGKNVLKGVTDRLGIDSYGAIKVGIDAVHDSLSKKVGKSIGDAGGSLNAESIQQIGGRSPWTTDLSHVTGKGAQSRNKAIEGIIKEDFPNLKLTFKPQYSPFARQGVAKINVGTQIGKASFTSRSNLRDTIIHEELHHRWWKRGNMSYHHSPNKYIPDEKFYRVINPTTILRLI